MAGKRSRATIKQVAQEAGVSVTTVSHYLAGRPSACSTETGERIREVVARLGYRPSAFGTSLKTQRSGMIGVFAHDPFSPPYEEPEKRDTRNGFVERIWRGVTQAADITNHPLIWYPNSTRLNPGVDSILSGPADAVLFLCSSEDPRPDLIAAHGIPVVVMTRSREASPLISLCYGNEQVTVDLIMSHLWNLGHRRIAHLTGPLLPFPALEPVLFQQSDIAYRRLEAYRSWMEARGAFDEDLVAESGGWGGHMVPSSMKRLMDQEKPPTAIFCANDSIALEAMDTAFRMGLTVPQDLSLVGVDNLAASATSRVPLTTVDISAEAIGQAAVHEVVRLLDHPGSPARDICTPVSTFLPRSSTAPPASVPTPASLLESQNANEGETHEAQNA